ncbi:MAG: helix-turn-helix transcriptional regulator [Patescibacteria group bacterium]|nr:helix-turn-helix transcriptional regulator [Patescibacteria group bacterium]
MSELRKGMKNLGEYIKSRRKELSLTQFQLADFIGVNESYISRLESGDRFHSINIDTAFGLATKLEITVEHIADLMEIKRA